MKEYDVYKRPAKKTGYWVIAAGYAYWHRTYRAAYSHACSIQWADAQISSAKTGEIV